jgi:hypothetical protein
MAIVWVVVLGVTILRYIKIVVLIHLLALFFYDNLGLSSISWERDFFLYLISKSTNTTITRTSTGI